MLRTFWRYFPLFIVIPSFIDPGSIPIFIGWILLSEGGWFNLIQNTPLWMKGVAFLDAMSRLALAGQHGINAFPSYTTPTNIIHFLKFVRKDTPFRGLFSSSSLTITELPARRAPVDVLHCHMQMIQFAIYCTLWCNTRID